MSVESIRPTQAVAPVEPVQLHAALEAVGARPGEAVAARVAAMLADGMARLAVGTGTLDVKTSQPLVPGTEVTLTVERGGQGVRITLAEPAAAAPRAAPALAAAAAPAAAPLTAPAPPPAGTVAAALVDLLARGLVAPAAPRLADGAQVALAARASSDPAHQAESAEDGASPPKALREALVQGVRAAAGRQDSMAGLFADLTAVAQGRTRTPIPPAVARAMAEVLGFRVPAETLATPAGLAAALADAGTQLEARLAALPPGMPLPPDLKASLQRLQTALAGWTAELDPAEGQGVPKPAGHERPPLRGALPHGQPARDSLLGPASTPAEVAGLLTERTEAALSRITLLQAASLPDTREVVRPEPLALATVEVPMRVGVETAVVQFQIQRDRDEPEEGPAAPRKGGDWTMRFSLDAEPLGPIHAAVRWHDGRVGIQLWAERQGVAAALDAQRAGLSDALAASAFTIDRLTIAAGAPPDPRQPSERPRHRLDRSS
ncbi:flagellar hook-length control protein FliK [Phreatobacter cathodiphilus]|uniref:flagellar hook-length control protein FliK n=1 Tax=Phreatobacter cathodiphilus TaxID=1868589 RepID=UPI0011B1C8EB|nr:flagellar hook-length control protein FliK [Phreatobacter cathodiphilus]